MFKKLNDIKEKNATKFERIVMLITCISILGMCGSLLLACNGEIPETPASIISLVMLVISVTGCCLM